MHTILRSVLTFCSSRNISGHMEALNTPSSLKGITICYTIVMNQFWCWCATVALGKQNMKTNSHEEFCFTLRNSAIPCIWPFLSFRRACWKYLLGWVHNIDLLEVLDASSTKPYAHAYIFWCIVKCLWNFTELNSYTVNWGHFRMVKQPLKIHCVPFRRVQQFKSSCNSSQHFERKKKQYIKNTPSLPSVVVAEMGVFMHKSWIIVWNILFSLITLQLLWFKPFSEAEHSYH